MYTARRFDPETGLYYYRARMYSPSIGRFLQTDPIGYGDGMNMYAYVGNNPTGFIDPFGLESKEGGFGFWDGIQGSLEAGGMVPAWGIVPDAINTVISTFRGKWGDALWNLGACIPAGGQFITGGRWAKRGVKAADAAHDAIKAADRANNLRKAFRLTSRIGDNSSLIRHAKAAGKRVQGSLDNLVRQLSKGNMNPGTGTKQLFKGIFEARAKDGARVYFRYVDDGVEILAKSDKNNQQAVINILREMY